MLGLNEFYKLSEKLEAKPFKMAGFVGGIIMYVTFIQAPLIFLNENDTSIKFLLVVIPFFILTVALFSRHEKPIHDALFTLAGLMYAVLPFALLNELTFIHNFENGFIEYFPKVILGVIFLIWSNDTFAYLGGSLFGKHKMIARISPGKTWEGTLFGIFVTFGISFLIQTYMLHAEGLLWPILGIIVPILSTVGDLVESMLKRQANIKDSGNIMPGHGGVLDRFDSLIFVTPFVYIIMKLL
jgi:phosphatidate cytidylyltransferase